MQTLQRPTQLQTSLKDFTDKVQSLMLAFAKSESQGLLKESSLYQLENPGKKLRSKLIFQLASNLQVLDFDSLALWSSANELIHEASLIHDDVQDHDRTRRNQDSLWMKYGPAQAINTGDFLLLLSLKPLLELGEFKLINLHTKTSYKLAQGQSEEIEQKESFSLHTNFYSECIEKKTAALFSSLALGVCHLTNLDDEETQQVGEIFLKLGCIFQMQDDILDLYGDKGRKSCGCDIKEGKISFLIHTHLLHHPEDKNFLSNLLSKDYQETTSEEIENLKELFVKKKTLDLCLSTLKSEIKALGSYALRASVCQKHNLNLNNFIQMVTQPIENLL